MEAITIKQYERLNPKMSLDVEGKKLVYSTPNSQTVWRVKSLFDKEPDTIAWLNSMDADDVLVDIGANVGMYTVYAAGVKGVKVFSFEPEAQNFAVLSRNILLNELSENITAFPVALSDKAEVGMLHLSSVQIGGSCHSFNEEINYHLKPHKFPFKQGCVSLVFDDLIAQSVVEVPTHIKIDVDGLEHKIIHGMKKTLENKKVKSVLIEINTHAKEHVDLIDYMSGLGFKLSEEQVNESVRKEGSFAGIGNHIFDR